MSAFTSAITEDDDGRKEANRIYYQSILQDRTVHHPHLDSRKSSTEPFCFVIGADTQLGMASVSSEWQTELNYCIKAINHINSMTQKPEFVCMCGDLVDMHPNLFNMSTPEDRIKIQMQQYADFQECWQSLNPDIPLLCLSEIMTLATNQLWNVLKDLSLSLEMIILPFGAKVATSFA